MCCLVTHNNKTRKPRCVFVCSVCSFVCSHNQQHRVLKTKRYTHQWTHNRNNNKHKMKTRSFSIEVEQIQTMCVLCVLLRVFIVCVSLSVWIGVCWFEEKFFAHVFAWPCVSHSTTANRRRVCFVLCFFGLFLCFVCVFAVVSLCCVCLSDLCCSCCSGRPTRFFVYPAHQKTFQVCVSCSLFCFTVVVLLRSHSVVLCRKSWLIDQCSAITCPATTRCVKSRFLWTLLMNLLVLLTRERVLHVWRFLHVYWWLSCFFWVISLFAN